MNKDFEKTIRDIVRVVQPSMADWDIDSVGDIEIKLPARVMSMEEMIERGMVDGYQHYMPGDNAYITIGEIHLRRP